MIALAWAAFDPDSVRESLIFLVTGWVSSAWYSQVSGAPAHSMPRNAMSTLPDMAADVAVEPGVDARGVGSHEDRPVGQPHAVGRLGADVQVGVLAEEGRRDHRPAGELHLGEVVHLDHRQADVRQVQRQRRVGQVAARGARHHHRADPAAQLQQRLQHDVVLMPVGDQRQVDVVGQVAVGVPVRRGGHPS